MEHTPGPWRELAPGVIAGATDPGWGAIANVPHANSEPESAANAKLIAAAPALLEALKEAALVLKSSITIIETHVKAVSSSPAHGALQRINDAIEAANG